MNADSQAKRRALRNRLKFTALAIFCSLIALICAIALFARQSQLVRQITAQQTGLAGWLVPLQTVSTSIMDADAGVRSYLLTGQNRYLAAYRDVTAQLPSLLAKIDTVPVVDPGIPAWVGGVRQQATAKLTELAATTAVYDRDGRDAAIALLIADRDRQSLERLRNDTASIISAMRTYRRVSVARVAASSIDTQRLTILTAAVLVASVILGGLQIKRLMLAHSRYERALAASERFVRMITDSVPTRMVYLDRERRLQFANQAVCDNLRLPREQILGQHWNSMTLERDPLLEGMVEAAFAGRSQRFEHTETAQGEVHRLESHLIPDLTSDGTVRGLFGIGVDITHLKSVEGALRDLTDVVEGTPDFVAQTDARGNLLYINLAARAALGFEAERSLDGLKFTDFYPESIVARFLQEIGPAVKEKGSWIGETEVILKDGRRVPVSHVVIGHRDARGRIARYSSLMRDISNEAASRRDLARQTATMNAVIEAMPAMVAVWDSDLRLKLANKAYGRWRGRRRRELIGHRIEAVLDEADCRHSLPWTQRALSGETVTYEREYSGALPSKHLSFTYIPLFLRGGKVGGFVCVAQDITHHREENVRLMLLTERDPLTGLLNRVGFEKYLIKRCEQGDGSSLAVLYIDLDHFKPINDLHGHATGDEVLREFAARLQQLVRPTDAVARLGGDEFGVALAGVREAEHARAVAEKVVQMARRPITVNQLTVNIGASIGIAFNADADGGWKGLVARADSMAYEAKARGRGQASLARGDEPTLRQQTSNGTG